MNVSPVVPIRWMTKIRKSKKCIERESWVFSNKSPSFFQGFSHFFEMTSTFLPAQDLLSTDGQLIWLHSTSIRLRKFFDTPRRSLLMNNNNPKSWCPRHFLVPDPLTLDPLNLLKVTHRVILVRSMNIQRPLKQPPERKETRVFNDLQKIVC